MEKIRIPMQDRSIEKKNLIINTAKKLFRSTDYHNISSVTICKEANLSIGTFYSYFKNKDDLIFSILSNICQEGIEKNKSLYLNSTLPTILQLFLENIIEVHTNCSLTFDYNLAITTSDENIKYLLNDFQKSMCTILNDIIKHYIPNYNESMTIIIYCSMVGNIHNNTNFNKDNQKLLCENIAKIIQ